MNSATPFPWPGLSATENAKSTFCAVFEHAPIPIARCTPQGVIVEMNPAFKRTLNCRIPTRPAVRLSELLHPDHRQEAESKWRDLFESCRESIVIEARGSGDDPSVAKWTAWRQRGTGGDTDHVLLMCQQEMGEQEMGRLQTAEQTNDAVVAEEKLLQTQRWEAVGRLTGGVVHDFNNLLTGVMLCCDLLLSSIDSGDCRRRYAEEIRSAIVQASSLVSQLLVFAKPKAVPADPISLNEIATAMRKLLARLIGENIELDLNLDPEIGLVGIDQAQAQQILLNLILNARDALPEGGRIVVETSNCNFQPLASSLSQIRPARFPCILLAVSDNGHGMNAETRRRLFEPFFTTKNEGKGTGLGLTTVRTIVTTHGGLIHYESESGRGTRAMILFPRSRPPADADFGVPDFASSEDAPLGPFRETKKESLL